MLGCSKGPKQSAAISASLRFKYTWTSLANPSVGKKPHASYVIDIYWGKIEPARSFTQFAAAIAFFPQIPAGPTQWTRRDQCANQWHWG